MKIPWPWRWNRADITESRARLEVVRAQLHLVESQERVVDSRQKEVDILTEHAEEIMRRNHLAEKIHQALGGI